MPHLGRHTDKIAFIKSVTHSDNAHSTSAHWMLTGHKHQLAQENFVRVAAIIRIGSVLNHLRPNTDGLPAFVALPEVIGTTTGYTNPGRTADSRRRHDPSTSINIRWRRTSRLPT